MKAAFRKSGSIVLAALLLFSTLSFTLDMHFCGKTLVDFSLFEEAEDCGMSMDDALTTEMGCCSDFEIVVQGQDDLDQMAQGSLIPAVVFVAYLSETFQLAPPQDLPGRFVPLRDYVPPLLIRDIPVCNQVFLI